MIDGIWVGWLTTLATRRRRGVAHMREGSSGECSSRFTAQVRTQEFPQILQGGHTLERHFGVFGQVSFVVLMRSTARPVLGTGGIIPSVHEVIRDARSGFSFVFV